MAEEKKDVIVPAAGNKKLQPGDDMQLHGPVQDYLKKSEEGRKNDDHQLNGPVQDYLKQSELNRKNDDHQLRGSAIGKDMSLRGPALEKTAETEKKDPKAGPPTYHKGIQSSKKNSSFGRSVPFSASASYDSMWKHSGRLAGTAIGNGSPDWTKLGLNAVPFPIGRGITVNGYAFDGAMPQHATTSNYEGISSTFHLSQDEDRT